MLRYLTPMMMFVYHSFIYNAEPLQQLNPEEYTLVSCVQTQCVAQLNWLKTEVNNFITLDQLRLTIETTMAQYPIDRARPSITNVVDTTVKSMLERENKNAVVLHKKIVHSLKDFCAIGLGNKKIFNALNELLKQAWKEKETIIDSFFIKWSTIAQAYCDISGKYDHSTHYFGLELIQRYGLFAKILREQDELVKSFIRAVFVQNALLLPKQLMLKKDQKKVAQNIELFLKKEVKTAKVYVLGLLIPLDLCPEESLLKFLCEEENIVMDDKSRDGHIGIVYLTPLEQKKV